MTFGRQLPSLRVPAPGPRSRAFVDRLAAAESPAFTTRRARRAERAGAPMDPIVWRRAFGANVEDADGNVYVDLTAGFGVAALGHAHPAVVEAARSQLAVLPHALGDLHPSEVKVALLEALAARAPFPDARVVLGLNGSDAIEVALKTAALHTGRAGVLAFDGGYHGLAYGPVAACGFQRAFREPFAAQLNPHVRFAPYPERPEGLAPALAAVDAALADGKVGAVLYEPLQGRGGVRVPAPGFLEGLRERAKAAGAIAIADEIFTGLGRCGVPFLSAPPGTAPDAAPDLLCLGKALAGGLPVSACVGRAEVMAAWGDPTGAALHTGTFYGHPPGCAAALAALDAMEEAELGARARKLGDGLRARLAALAGVAEVRGLGLMVGLVPEAPRSALGLVAALLGRGYLTLPAGGAAEVLQLAPPLTIPEALLDGFVHTLASVLAEGASS
ncbi:MAG: aminotransferase class III-fold pyridoxal phosphate-dependent enzyme [Myxococcota bacterium]